MTADIRLLSSIVILNLLSVPAASAEDRFVTSKPIGKGWVLTSPASDPNPLKHETPRVRCSWTITAEKIAHPTPGDIEAFGKVVVEVQGQKALLKADQIKYDRKSTILHAVGHVQIFRKGVVTEVSATRFKVESTDYIVTETGITLSEPELKIHNRT